VLYKVRLQFCLHVEAGSKSEAFTKASRILQTNPGSAIASVEQADAPKGNPPLWKRLLTGK
jgi:hypothetical protein